MKNERERHNMKLRDLKKVWSHTRGKKMAGKRQRFLGNTESSVSKQQGGEAISYQAITGQEAEPSVAFRPVKLTHSILTNLRL